MLPARAVARRPFVGTVSSSLQLMRLANAAKRSCRYVAAKGRILARQDVAEVALAFSSQTSNRRRLGLLRRGPARFSSFVTPNSVTTQFYFSRRNKLASSSGNTGRSCGCPKDQSFGTRGAPPNYLRDTR